MSSENGQEDMVTRDQAAGHSLQDSEIEGRDRLLDATL